MWSYFRSLGAKRIALEQVPAVSASIVIAELYYKFHSFTLECLAFLATWCMLDAAFGAIRRRRATQSPGGGPSER